MNSDQTSGKKPERSRFDIKQGQEAFLLSKFANRNRSPHIVLPMGPKDKAARAWSCLPSKS